MNREEIKKQIDDLQFKLALLDKTAATKAEFEAWIKGKGFESAASFLEIAGYTTSEKPAKEKQVRTRLTQEQRTQIFTELRAGAVASALAGKFNVSIATIQNLKRSIGLVGARKS